ncbi:hypothetical protein F5Y17DRAFT_183378 [Xylariaceae sp. FL0594]|nr:hypothetical protein F5Y17DRAFT_183378 [Xylariaceae sp. FL0594]
MARQSLPPIPHSMSCYYLLIVGICLLGCAFSVRIGLVCPHMLTITLRDGVVAELGPEIVDVHSVPEGSRFRHCLTLELFIRLCLAIAADEMLPHGPVWGNASHYINSFPSNPGGDLFQSSYIPRGTIPKREESPLP